MNLRNSLWIFACAFAVFLLLCFLRLFNVLGSEAIILIRWISTVSLILCGVFVGIFISEKQIRVQDMLVPFLLFGVGFFAAPFVGVGFLMLFKTFALIRGIEPIIFGGSVAVYLSLYMGLWFWLKKKGIFTFKKRMDDTEKG
jgi:hypothetical protein